MDKLFDTAVFMRYALDSVPSMVLVTDDDARIHFRNKAAKELIASEKVYGNRLGEVMHCIHSEDVPAGCGQGPHCQDCVVRNAVKDAFSGKALRRQRSDISVKAGGITRVIPALVSASPFTYEGRLYSMIVIEDISELAELRSLLPICSSCKKIQDENGQWEKVETYLKRHLPESNLSHGLCPACAKKLYPGYAD